jgi:hypothetical protein
MTRAVPFLVAAACAVAALLSLETGAGEDRLAKRSGEKCAAALCAMSIF